MPASICLSIRLTLASPRYPTWSAQQAVKLSSAAHLVLLQAHASVTSTGTTTVRFLELTSWYHCGRETHRRSRHESHQLDQELGQADAVSQVSTLFTVCQAYPRPHCLSCIASVAQRAPLPRYVVARATSSGLRCCPFLNAPQFCQVGFSCKNFYCNQKMVSRHVK
jgi:hypothetical protein